MDAIDILIFALALIGMVVSAVTKNAKKKAQDHKPLPNFDQWSMDEDDMYNKTEPVIAYNVEDPYDEEQTYWSYDKEAIKELESSAHVDDLNREHKHHVTDDNAYKIKDDKNIADTGISLFDGGVNLRDAIIYSELLKPKYKEY